MFITNLTKLLHIHVPGFILKTEIEINPPNKMLHITGILQKIINLHCHLCN